MIIRVGHLYPEYLNIYADRGNIAVLERRAAARGHELRVDPLTVGTPLDPASHDLLYIGGGQDREQGMIAPDLAARADGIRAAVDDGAAVLAVCGGYQLLGAALHNRQRPAEYRSARDLTPVVGDVLEEQPVADPAAHREAARNVPLALGERGLLDLCGDAVPDFLNQLEALRDAELVDPQGLQGRCHRANSRSNG